ncbi:hypothetical protein BMS97_01710 [Leuconostoc mesenteroides subsp. mesenteroides]|uniref:hypothetical protein n=1 Tax=Leuconostoc mesenteroides TaxID=1245 RepID=UPI0009FCF293|nr:hypothetical protein [Leuconostoc mesenteroides]ARN64122.1 hypothetical protein A0F18_08750 [Leuconostoc mesenteroides subsp. mesenteroides]MDV8927636.1 hypothetical protein [Leuconostoc mesenteroides]ORI91406.1 hypothetical protein BMS97_01710 [Leuconostoc mesenteroides subsp. mesenteroides]ORI92319.1 hypothetical protein BMS98_06060 [Leuconostoc mesenteroides subsp. mesenteroides]
MSNAMMFLWLILSVAFWVTLIILILNKFRKKESKLTWKTPLILFIAGCASLIVGVSSMPQTNNRDTSSDSSVSDAKIISKKSSSENSAESSSKAAEASSRAAAMSSSEAVDKDPNSYKTGITYDQVARTPDDYEGKKMQFTGRVIQVIEDKSETQIRLAVDGNSDNIILVGFDPDILNGSRVLEDDLVTVSGTSVGTVSYKSTMGGKITIPAMAAKIINDQGKASDDYGY